MARTFRSDDCESYKINTREPHIVLEPMEKEIAVVDEALGVLREEGILPHIGYDNDKFLAHRKLVRETFDIPWTGITPRMQRLLYAINAILQPQNMVAAGVFCGNTFISNAAAAVGPGAVYTAKNLMVTPETAKIGLGDLDDKRLAGSIATVSEAYGLKRTPDTSEVFNRSFLPPRAEREIKMPAN